VYHNIDKLSRPCFTHGSWIRTNPHLFARKKAPRGSQHAFFDWVLAMRLWFLLPLPFVVALVSCGCSNKVGTTPANFERLRLLTTAYVEANQELGRAPANADDLEPFLKKHGNPAELLRSHQNNEEFVILWGVDQRTKDEAAGSGVIAYEKSPRKGLRYVGFSTYVVELSEEQFRALKFPSNHNPP
jgi:hypothetical protein